MSIRSRFGRSSRLAWGCSALWIAVAAMPGPAAAQAKSQAQAKLPKAVQKELAEMAQACREAGGKPMKSPKLLQIADLTGDGLADFVIDQGVFNCRGAASLFSGSGGSHVTAYAGTPDGQAVRVFSSGTFEVKMDSTSKPASLELTVGGPLCGQRLAANTPRSEYQSCWRPVVWDARRKKMDFAPVSQVRGIP